MASPSHAKAKRLNRRSKRRNPMEHDLVTVEMSPGRVGLMVDVCENGVGVQTINELEKGSTVEVAFTVPDSNGRIEGTGLVTWYDGEGRAGIQFKNLKSGSADLLKKLIASLPAPPEVEEEIPATGPQLLGSVSDHVRGIQAQIASARMNVDQALQFLTDKIVELTNANGSAIAIGSPEDMVCRASAGLAPEVGVKIDPSSALTFACIQSKKTIHCRDTETDKRVDRAVCRELNLRSLLIYPILKDSEVKGVMEVFSPIANAFEDHHVDLMQDLSEITAQIAWKVPAAPKPEIPAKSNGMPKPFGANGTGSADLRGLDVDGLLKSAAAEDATAAPKPVAVPKPVAPKVEPKVEAKPAPVKPVQTTPAPVKASTSAAAAAAPAKEKEKKPMAPVVAISSKEEKVPTALIPPVDEPAEEAGDSRKKLVIGAAVAATVLLIGGGGLWLRSGTTQTAQAQPATVAASTATPNPVMPGGPATPATTTSTSTASPTSALPQTSAATRQESKKKTSEEELAADRVGTSPVILASPKAVGTRDEGTVEAPSVTLAGNLNLSSVSLPAVNGTPSLQTQSMVKGGTLLKRVNPTYPEFAKKQRIEGDVNLRIHIGKDGHVENVQMISGNKFLASAAMAAVKQWKYEPVTLNGQAQAVDNSVVVRFNLPKQ